MNNSTNKESVLLSMKKEGLRLTSARKKIIELLAEHKGHMSPQEIFNELHELGFASAASTVYRELQSLEEHGFLHSSLFQDGTRRYELLQGKHLHFVCQECNKIKCFPIDEEILKLLQKKMQKDGLNLKELHIEATGTCTP